VSHGGNSDVKYHLRTSKFKVRKLMIVAFESEVVGFTEALVKAFLRRKAKIKRERT